MKNTSTYNYIFKNGTITISRGVNTRKYDWFLQIDLNKDEEGNKQFIGLDQKVFLTKKYALKYASELLNKYKLN